MTDDVDVFMSRLNPDMCVVTAVAGAERSGCLVGFSSQCSIDPVRYVVWISKANHTYGVARAADCLAVHLLTREQHGTAVLFGGETGDRTDKFAQVPWKQAYGGSVVLEEAAAWFVGTVEDRVDGGDHVGFILRPVEWRDRKDGPLLRLDDATDITPGHPA
ncbi:flavin reductase family protein [Streptomyces sp. NPDC050534]|uniref:flavin reductase family protein n=1 Tax=Streptomyces sp. NPDC050534 TaxID=3365625 RepID=UPI0037B2B0E8